MDIREKLVELLQVPYRDSDPREPIKYVFPQTIAENLADHLIANGVMIKPAADYHDCEYCDDPHPARDCALPDGTEQMLVCYPDGTIWGKPFIHTRKINFCPMCGRKLLEEE